MKALWITLVIFLGGCTVTLPHVEEYTITPKVEQKVYTAKSCKEKSLKIGQVFSSNSLMSHKMKYIEDEYKKASFTQSQWERTPNRAISDALVKSIRSSALFDNVSSFRSRSKTDLLLEAHVERFVQYFTQSGEKSYAEVSVSLNLLDVKNSHSIGHTTFSTQIDTKSMDAKGGVIALNSALGEVLSQTNSWLNGVCQ